MESFQRNTKIYKRVANPFTGYFICHCFALIQKKYEISEKKYILGIPTVKTLKTCFIVTMFKHRLVILLRYESPDFTFKSLHIKSCDYETLLRHKP